MPPNVIEGTWEEIKEREAELVDRDLRVTILPTTSKKIVEPRERVSVVGKYAGLLSSEDFIRGKGKQEEIDFEERMFQVIR